MEGSGGACADRWAGGMCTATLRRGVLLLARPSPSYRTYCA